MNVCKGHVYTVSSTCMDVNGLPQVLNHLSLGLLWLWRSMYPCRTATWQSMCLHVDVCMCAVFARTRGELALSGDVMPWLACCGTWPRLCCVSSALQGSVIPQPPAYNTHHSIPQTTTEQNSTTPGTMSTMSFRRRRGRKKRSKANTAFHS